MIKTIAIAASLFFLVGCTTRTIDSACLSFGQITYSAAGDTTPTKDQIKKHNAAHKAICG